MKIAVRNLKNSHHTISRINGQVINIEPNSFIILDTDDEAEVQYWLNCDKKVLKRCGLSVVTDDRQINSLASSVGVSIKKDVSVVDGFASPIVEEESKTVIKESTNVEQTDNPYSEESLLKMDKEDLFNLCDNFNIKYKRSNSVKTLVNLILGSGKV